jgi:glycosyltransferase involved in cell wall biosynthesis
MGPHMAVDAVVVYPGFNAYYYSFYLEGILEAFAGRVRFSAKGFPAFASNKLAFRVVRAGTEARVLVDATDRSRLDSEALAWSDIYGKVNRRSADVPSEAASKVLAIGPSFPFRVWSPARSWQFAFRSYLQARRGLESVREHFANWRRQYRYALPPSEFRPAPSADRFVFSSNSLWKDDMETNHQRAAFFEACRSIEGLEFEGGFNPRSRGEVPGFEKYSTSRRYPISEYIQKTRRSAVVFNTPAVFECHGFKLGEYLALGKAIISTPLKRELPAPLVHGEHVHFVDSPDAMPAAIRRILDDRRYRGALESGARAYFDQYLRPRPVIERLVATGAVA